MSDAEIDGSLTDTALARRAAAGDGRAFGVLVERHQASIFRVARAMTRDHAAAEDVLQQTFLAAWQALPRFRGEASVRTWLLTIARHAAWHTRQDAAREAIDDTPIEVLGLEAGWGAASAAGPEAQAIQAQCREQLAQALARLEPDDRAILTLRELEGLSGDETAAILQLSVAAMKSRLHRARLRLAADLRVQSGKGHGHAAR